MARCQFGWFVKKLYFTKEETENLADALAVAGIASASIPEPLISKAVAMSAGLVALVARRALRKDKALGLQWVTLGLAPMPFFHDEVW